MPFQADQQLEYKAKYDLRLADCKSVSDEALIRTNVDPTAVATLIRSRWPLVQEYRSRLAELPGHDIATTDKVLDYAMALAHANAMYNADSEPSEDLPQVVEDAMKLRTRLSKIVQAVVELGVIHVAQEKLTPPTRAYDNIVTTLLDLKAIFEQNKALLLNKTPITEEDLQKASSYASYIQGVLAVRERDTKRAIEAASIRDRFFTLTANGWDEIRRGATYLRWKEKDYDSIFPSIYTTRVQPTKGKDDAEKVSKPAAQAEPTPAPLVKPAGPKLPDDPDSNPFE